MGPAELLQLVAQTLESIGVPYFVTGSVATSAYGEYRGTADVDIVVRIEPSHVAALCAAFPADRYCLSPDAVRDAIRHRGQFNIIDSKSGYKADLIVSDGSPQTRQRFERALRIQPAGSDRTIWFASPEDVIIKKLEFHREGGSDKHLRDIAGILKTMGEQLDQSYIQQWADRVDLADLWRLVQERVASST